MSDQTPSRSQKRELPDAAKIQKALEHRSTRRWKPVVLTFEFKIRRPSGPKRARILRTASYVTNVKAQILEHYKEDYTNPRSDGAIALVLSVPGSAANRSNTIGARINSELVAYLPPDYRFSSRVRDGACRAAATMMITWVQSIAAFVERREAATDASKQAQATATEKPNRRKQASDVLKGLTVEQLYAAWRRQAELYDKAAATLIPFGRHKGVRLDEIGRREARWLISRMLPKEEIARTITLIEQLLQEPSNLLSDAAFAPHPYKRNDRRKHALQARRLVQRLIEPSPQFEPTLLGLLQADELKALQNELKEMLQTGAVRDATLDVAVLQEALTETAAASASLETLEDAFETFLYGKPMNFPSISRVGEEGTISEQAIDEYRASLNWFRPNLDRLGDVEKYANERLEAQARDHLARTHGRLSKLKLQPIPFIGTNKPRAQKPLTRDCALLFDEKTHEYVFAAMLRGQADPLSDEERARRKTATPQSTLRYANYPLHKFTMPRTAAIELFPLEWGEGSARKRFREKREPLLKALIEQQRQAQEARFQEALVAEIAQGTLPEEAQRKAREASLEIEPIFTTARIVVAPDADGKQAFFVQMTVNMPAAERHPPATTVIGFHEHDAGYSYAVVGLDGRPVRDNDGNELVGDLTIPTHVDPLLGARTSDNYAFEIANALIRQAGGACIGIEETGYKRVKSDLSRERNKAIFQRPSKRIIDIADYKARMAGIPAPLLIRNIAPSRDCSACLVRLPKGTDGIEIEYRTKCPDCSAECIVEHSTYITECPVCRHAWKPLWSELERQRWFACPECTAPRRPARFNTAIVVAQETLRILARLNISGSDDGAGEVE
jgi:hypothetical protein